MKYYSTRGGESSISFEKVVLNGLATDGGLYIPEIFPHFNHKDFSDFRELEYSELAYKITKDFIGKSIPLNDYQKICQNTYSNFSSKEIINLSKLRKNEFILNLYNGPTYAFKDFALQLLGNIYEYILKKKKKQLIILGATSGDTGSAAIHGCSKSKSIKIFILFPYKKVSEIQRKQMTTIDKCNVFNIAVKGDFDDCQALVKKIFQKNSKGKSLNLAAINSINWVRIMGQIVYYFWAYLKTCKKGEQIIFSIPTGNFGNVYAGFVAKLMGLPIKKLVVSSNSNDVLTRFFSSGCMEKKKTKITLSPSMDIQVSSNFERLMDYYLDRNSLKLSKLYQSLENEGKFVVSKKMLKKISLNFYGGKINDKTTQDVIKDIYFKNKIIIDPHTAVGIKVGRTYNKINEKIIFLSTAHHAKFLETVKKSTKKNLKLPSDLIKIMAKREKYTVINNSMKELEEFITKNST